MDTLALLCNLHADGPATLAKLRAVGCRSLAELERMPQRALAHALGGDAERARRFLREAKLLGGRVDAGPPEGVAPAARGHAVPTPAPQDEVGGPFAAVDPAAADPFASPASADEHGARREHFAMQPLKDAVLRVWSEQDRLDPPRDGASESGGRAGGADARLGSIDELAVLDGCDALARKALSAAGVGSAADFLARDPLELASRTGLAYSALNRWRFLLRRRVDSGALR